MYAVPSIRNPDKPPKTSRFQAGIGLIARMVELADTLDLGVSIFFRMTTLYTNREAEFIESPKSESQIKGKFY